jgi:hypothetical protein
MRTALVIVGLCAATGLGAGVSSADTLPPNPAANRTLSPATVQVCDAGPASTTCRDDALADINSARQSEGVGPMVLPTDFSTLTVPEQLLVLSDLERLDRGYTVEIEGLSNGLDANAAASVDSGDPSPNPWYGDSYSANWEGGYASPLEADFAWMYDDGPGSGNEDCTSTHTSGCWGHRDDILDPSFTEPLVMGAADDDSSGEATEDELFVGGDTETGAGEPDAPLAPTWATIAADLPLGVSPASVALPAGTASAAVTVSDSGIPSETITAAASGGWRVSPGGCSLTAGSSCALTVRQSASGGAGTLTLTAPNGTQTVALNGLRSTSLSAVWRGGFLAYGRSATIVGRLLLIGGTGAADETVTLDATPAGAATPTALGTGLTGPAGAVRFTVRPLTDTRYTLAFAGSSTLGPSSSGPFPVAVSQAVTARVDRTTVATGQATHLSGSVVPAAPGRRVELQREDGGTWRTVGSTRLGAASRYRFTIVAGPPGLIRYRVFIRGNARNAFGTSPTRRLRVT